MKLQIIKSIIPILQNERVKSIERIDIQDIPGIKDSCELIIYFSDKSWFRMVFENRGILQEQIMHFDREFSKFIISGEGEN